MNKRQKKWKETEIKKDQENQTYHEISPPLQPSLVQRLHEDHSPEDRPHPAPHEVAPHEGLELDEAVAYGPVVAPGEVAPEVALEDQHGSLDDLGALVLQVVLQPFFEKDLLKTDQNEKIMPLYSQYQAYDKTINGCLYYD